MVLVLLQRFDLPSGFEVVSNKNKTQNGYWCQTHGTTGKEKDTSARDKPSSD